MWSSFICFYVCVSHRSTLLLIQWKTTLLIHIGLCKEIIFQQLKRREMIKEKTHTNHICTRVTFEILNVKKKRHHKYSIYTHTFIIHVRAMRLINKFFTCIIYNYDARMIPKLQIAGKRFKLIIHIFIYNYTYNSTTTFSWNYI